MIATGITNNMWVLNLAEKTSEATGGLDSGVRTIGRSFFEFSIKNLLVYSDP